MVYAAQRARCLMNSRSESATGFGWGRLCLAVTV